MVPFYIMALEKIREAAYTFGIYMCGTFICIFFSVQRKIMVAGLRLIQVLCVVIAKLLIQTYMRYFEGSFVIIGYDTAHNFMLLHVYFVVE